VKKGEVAPAVIGIFGMAPIDFKLTNPTKPPVREGKELTQLRAAPIPSRIRSANQYRREPGL
jgi:hypothetical protein